MQPDPTWFLMTAIDQGRTGSKGGLYFCLLLRSFYFNLFLFSDFKNMSVIVEVHSDQPRPVVPEIGSI